MANYILIRARRKAIIDKRARKTSEAIAAKKKAGMKTRGKRLSPEEAAALMRVAPRTTGKRKPTPAPEPAAASNRRRNEPVPPTCARISRAAKTKAAEAKAAEKEMEEKKKKKG